MIFVWLTEQGISKTMSQLGISEIIDCNMAIQSAGMCELGVQPFWG